LSNGSSKYPGINDSFVFDAYLPPWVEFNETTSERFPVVIFTHGIGMAFGTDCVSAADVTARCRAATARPLIVKLSPNVTDIVAIARSVEAAGADSVSLVNTLLGMAVDVNTMRPKLARVVGGLSGPAIKPVALRMVWQVASAVDIPVVGMGGIMTAEDAVEFLLVGATAVAVGTANFVDPTATTSVIDGLEHFCRSRGIGSATELIGGLEA